MKAEKETSELSAFNAKLLKEITERKRVEEQLRESQAALEEAQQIAKIGNWRWSLSRDELISCSEEYARIHGVSIKDVHDVMKRQMEDVIHPDDRHRVESDFGRAYDSASEFRVKYQTVRPNGDVRHVQEIGRAIREDNGEIIEEVGTVQDITEHVLSEQALMEAKEAAADTRLWTYAAWACLPSPRRLST